MKEKSVGIILAGGIGSRFKGDKPKQYYLINGKELIWYTIDAFKKAKSLDAIVVVLDETEYNTKRIEKEYNVQTVLGGPTRNHSFKNALNYIKEHYPNCEKIIENNAACPFITPKIIDKYIDLLDEYDFVQTTFKITDALGSYKSRTVSREDYYLIQSPDAYKFPVLYKNFDANHPNGHPAAQLPGKYKGYNYWDFGTNIKVTYPEDIAIAEILINKK